jgi:hypothetical protein
MENRAEEEDESQFNNEDCEISEEHLQADHKSINTCI